jgi:thiamine pyrophosphokinase
VAAAVAVTPALVFANGDPLDGPMVRRWLARAAEPYLLAADGGAHTAALYGVRPQRVIGDMDSVTPALLADLEARGVDIVRYGAAKDETDLELSLIDAAARGCDPIIVIGAVGGRLDHTLANVYLLALSQLDGRTVRLVAGREEVMLLRPGVHTLSGVPGDTVSLLPIGGPAGGVTTTGLAYPLRGETLHFGPARGVSNVMQGETAEVSLDSGWLLLIHTEGRA